MFERPLQFPKVYLFFFFYSFIYLLFNPHLFCIVNNIYAQIIYTKNFVSDYMYYLFWFPI